MGIDVTRQWRTRSGRMVVGLKETLDAGKPALTGQVLSDGGGLGWRIWTLDGKHARHEPDLDLVPAIPSGPALRPPTAGFASTAAAIAAAAPDAPRPQPCRFLTGEWQTRDGGLVTSVRESSTRKGFLTGKVRRVGKTDWETRNWRQSDGTHDSGINQDRNLDLVPLGTATEPLPTPPPPPPPFNPLLPFRTRSGLQVSLSSASAAPGYEWAGWVSGGSVQSVLYRKDGTAWKWGGPMPGLDLVNVALPPKPEMPPIAPPPEPVDPVKEALKESFLRAIRERRGSSVSGRVITSVADGVATIGQRQGAA